MPTNVADAPLTGWMRRPAFSCSS